LADDADDVAHRFGEHAAAAGLAQIDAGAERLALRVALEAARDNDHLFSQPPRWAPAAAAAAAQRAPARAVRVVEAGEPRFVGAAAATGFDAALSALLAADVSGGAALDSAIDGALRCGFASAPTLAALHVAPAGVPPAAAALAARFGSGGVKKKKKKGARRSRSPPPLLAGEDDEDDERPWVLRPLADAVSARHHFRAREAFAPRALHAALDAATRDLCVDPAVIARHVTLGMVVLTVGTRRPPLRAELIGRDFEGAAYWCFRAEREYNYAPHRVWVQRPPEDAGPHADAPDAPEKNAKPGPRPPCRRRVREKGPARSVLRKLPPRRCWGYYGDLKSVTQLARSLRPEEADLERNFDIRLAA
jgi:hypothetical protein